MTKPDGSSEAIVSNEASHNKGEVNPSDMSEDMEASITQAQPFILLVTRTIIREDSHSDKVILVRRPADDEHNPHKWEFPGGKVDLDDSSVERAQKREVYEETGLFINRWNSQFCQDSFLIKDGRYKGSLYVGLYGIAVVVGGRLKLSDEHDKAEWVTKDGVRGYELTMESFKAFQDLRSQLTV